MLPQRVAVDSGNWTDAVYTAVRERQHKHWMAIKGASVAGKTILGRPSLKDVTVFGRTLKSGLALYPIGTDTAKDLLLDRLALSVHKPKDQRWFHLPADMPDAWFAGITSERRDPETERWVPVKLSKVRNEDIDTLVYAYAAATHPRVGLLRFREADWTRLEQYYQPPIRDLFAVADVPGNALKRPSDPAPSTRIQPMPPAPGMIDGRSSR